jgi:hypothetical protein
MFVYFDMGVTDGDVYFYLLSAVCYRKRDACGSGHTLNLFTIKSNIVKISAAVF